MYIYFNDNDYVYAYGSEPIDGSIEIDSLPVEVDKYLGAYKYNRDTKEFIPDSGRIEYLEEQWRSDRELTDLLRWFAWYDQQCMQYQREMRLGIKSDKNMEDLDLQAVHNAEEIKRLREILASPYIEKK